jgi:hypothetical protein
MTLQFNYSDTRTVFHNGSLTFFECASTNPDDCIEFINQHQGHAIISQIKSALYNIGIVPARPLQYTEIKLECVKILPNVTEQTHALVLLDQTKIFYAVRINCKIINRLMKSWL